MTTGVFMGDKKAILNEINVIMGDKNVILSEAKNLREKKKSE